MAETPRPQADQREQKIVNVGAMQAARTLTSPQAAAAMAAEAKVKGPAQAIAEALRAALEAMVKVAASKGVQMPPDVIQAIAMSLAQLLSAAMVNAKFADDPAALLQKVMQLLTAAAPNGAAGPGAPGAAPPGRQGAAGPAAPAAPTGMLATAGGV